MKRYILSAILIMSITLFSTKGFAQAQNDNGDTLESIILRKSGTFPKDMTIQIHGDKITINGKTPKDIDIIRKKSTGNNSMNFHQFQGGNRPPSGFQSHLSNNGRALLGVLTLKSDSSEGARVEEVERGTAADSAGLQKGDIIIGVNDKKISSPDDLSNTIRSFSPGDKVTIAYLRENQRNKTMLTLGRIDNPSFGSTPSFGQPNSQNGNGMQEWFRRVHPHIDMNPNLRMHTNSRSQLGVVVEKHTKPEGALVVHVSPNSVAEKAGFENNDIILTFGKEKIGNIEDLKEAIKENQGNTDIPSKIKRGKKTITLHVSFEGKKERSSL